MSKDPFEDAIPLEKSLEAPEEEELTEEDLELFKFGMTSQYSKNFKNTYPDKQILTKGKPTKLFVEFYLTACNDKEEKALLNNMDKFPKPLQELIRKDSNSKGNVPSEDLISQYIEKNAELIAEKDTLFKKIQELQIQRDDAKTERDKLKEDIKEAEIQLNESAKIYSLADKLIHIFKDQKIKADLPNETIQLIKELSK